MRRARDWTITGLAALSDGGIAISGYDGLWGIDAAGVAQPIAAGKPGRDNPGSLTSLPDGSLVFAYGNGDALAVVHRNGRLERIRGATGLFDRPGFAPLGECTVVAAPYGPPGKVLGVLGVIGPTRMEYERVIPVVQATARIVTGALNRS